MISCRVISDPQHSRCHECGILCNLPFITADASGPKHLDIKLTRARLEVLVAELLDKLETPCRVAFKDAGLDANPIDEIILVGGMTRMPAVQERVQKIFGKAPCKGVNPDEVVALGAAVQGAVLKGDLKDVLLLDVTPLSLGIETLGGMMTRLIEKNTTIPVRKSEVFSTAEDNQPAVSIQVLQGEREVATGNKPLGRFDLVGIQPAPRGMPQIEVTFDIDANGIVNVSAKDRATGKEQSIQITASSGLSRQEIDRLVKDAALHAEEDRIKKERVEARNTGEALIHATEKTLAEMGDKATPEVRQEVEAAVHDLKQAVKNSEASSIRQATERLTQAAHKLAQQVYQQPGPGNERSQADRSGATDEDVIDAEFKDVA